MNCIAPGQHGSTYGGNPLACAVACTALDVLVDENLVERSLVLGEHFRTRLNKLKHIHEDVANGRPGFVTAVRGKGLMNAIDINPEISNKGRGAWHLCLLMASKGLLAKPTHQHTMLVVPPFFLPQGSVCLMPKLT
jgi:ornithine--oxo-acid transaminase